MKCPLFVELCAGTAAVSLRLQGGRRCRPPVSRMGAKTGYASEILALFGLTAGQGADAYLWCEPDDGARMLLEARLRPDVIREAADIIRSWGGEDPRALWLRLRAMGEMKNGSPFEVARWFMLCTWSYKTGVPASGFAPCRFNTYVDRYTGGHSANPHTAAGEAALLVKGMCENWPTVSIHRDARDVDPVAGAVCYIDPPYVATTGYKHDLGRAEVVDLAVKWANAGAFVGVSEQTPVEELVAMGWHAVNLTNGRRGQKRTFSKQQEEWVTLSRPPVRVPLLGSQISLFGAL